MKNPFLPRQLGRFWHFVAERHKAFYRRKVLRLAPPWTDDPVIAGNHFTNVYRELDPGTSWLRRNVLDSGLYTDDEKGFLTLVYRLFATEQVFMALGVPSGDAMHPMLPQFFQPKWLEGKLLRLQANGEKAFTSAYMVSNYGLPGPKATIMAGTVAGFAKRWPDVWEHLTNGCSERQHVHSALSMLYGVGKFIAFQALVDYCYPIAGRKGAGLLPYDNNGWVAAGPGAMKGLKILKPGTRSNEDDKLIGLLAKMQQDALARLDMPWLLDERNRPILLSTSNIQNCLCEFSKYDRLGSASRSGRKRLFVAEHARGRDDSEVEAHGGPVRYAVQVDAFI